MSRPSVCAISRVVVSECKARGLLVVSSRLRLRFCAASSRSVLFCEVLVDFTLCGDVVFIFKADIMEVSIVVLVSF